MKTWASLAAAISLNPLFIPTAPLAHPANTASPSPDGANRVRGDQWHLDYLNVEEAHQISRGAGVVVAVTDTGVYPHTDLHENVLDGIDLLSETGGNGHEDHNGHGTGMAGLIAAHGRRDGTGALGIAPQAKILPIMGPSNLTAKETRTD